MLESATSTITLPYTEDKSLVGSSTIKLVVSISQPDDYTKATYTLLESEGEFQVEIIDPCLTTELLS